MECVDVKWKVYIIVNWCVLILVFGIFWYFVGIFLILFIIYVIKFDCILFFIFEGIGVGIRGWGGYFDE